MLLPAFCKQVATRSVIVEMRRQWKNTMFKWWTLRLLFRCCLYMGLKHRMQLSFLSNKLVIVYWGSMYQGSESKLAKHSKYSRPAERHCLLSLVWESNNLSPLVVSLSIFQNFNQGRPPHFCPVIRTTSVLPSTVFSGACFFCKNWKLHEKLHHRNL